MAMARPIKNNSGNIHGTIELIIHNIIPWLHQKLTQEQVEKHLFQAIRSCFPHLDGFKLASYLTNKLKWINVDSELVSILDEVEPIMAGLHTEWVRKWAGWCDIKPIYPVGHTVFADAFGEAVITKIIKETAEYQVKKKKDKGYTELYKIAYEKVRQA